LLVFPEKFDKLENLAKILPEKLKFTKAETLDLLCCTPELAKMEERHVLDNIPTIRKYFTEEILKEYPVLLARAQNADKSQFYLNLYLGVTKEDFNDIIKRFPILLTAEVIIE
jgi:hypothetical protein